MKRNKIGKVFSLLLVTAILSAGISAMPVEAGSSDIIIDATTYSEEFDNSVWNNPDSDLTISNGAIVFDNSSTDATRLITKTAVKSTAEVDEVVKAVATMQFTQLPENQKFAVALGVQRIESMQGEPGNVEITFANNGGLTASVIYYNEDGDATVLAAAKKCGSITSKITLEASVTANQKLSVKINDTQLFHIDIPVSGEGRIGFLQTGSCGLKLSNVKIISHLYDAPENSNIFEDFEKGCFNANLISSKMRGASYVCWPSGTSISEHDGSQVFKYNNAGECYIATKYKYSNFEMTFDIPYLQRDNILDENGNLVTARSNQFGISYGGEASDFDYAGYTDAVTDVIWFTSNSRITSMKSGNMVDLSSLGYPIYAKECDKGFSVKITMTNSVVKVFMKWLDEKEYKEVFTSQLSTKTPTGYLHLWTVGPTNMAIDNFKVKNTDKNPNLVAVDYKSSVIEGPGDYEYKPMEKVYQEAKEADSGFNWYLIPIIVAVVCVLSLGVVVSVISIKKKRERKVKRNDKE